MSNKRVKSVFVRQRTCLEGVTKEQRLVRLEKEKKRKRLSRQNESDEQRQKRLEAQRKRNRVRLQIETSDQRYHRLQDLRDRANKQRQKKQYQVRLEYLREKEHERRQNESEEQHQVRLEDLRERDHERRQNEQRERRLQNTRVHNQVMRQAQSAPSSISEEQRKLTKDLNTFQRDIRSYPLNVCFTCDRLFYRSCVSLSSANNLLANLYRFDTTCPLPSLRFR